jgi:hypothetical protein
MALEFEQGGREGEQPPSQALLQQPSGAEEPGLDGLGPDREVGGGFGRAQARNAASIKKDNTL